VSDYLHSRVHYIEATSSHRGRITYYGVKHVSEVAAHGFESCLNQIQKMADSYSVRRELWEKHPIKQKAWPTFADYSRIAKSEFCYGIVTGLARRWREQPMPTPPAETTALAINEDDVADKWIEKREVKLEERTVKQPEYATCDGHHIAGEALSRFIEIHAGLGGVMT